jgi:HTH-type transcriptional regulator/antitoxin HigA
MGDLVAQYENAHVPPIPATGIDALKLLMENHAVGQADLSEIASQGVISELLNGKRDLNVRHIRALSERFGVPAQVFIG